MAEYIDKEEVLKRLNDFNEWCKDGRLQGSLFAVDVIKDIPSADVQPIRRGHWIIIDDTEQFIAKCSVCERIEDSRCIDDIPYCHCGAKMDGDMK